MLLPLWVKVPAMSEPWVELLQLDARHSPLSPHDASRKGVGFRKCEPPPWGSMAAASPTAERSCRFEDDSTAEFAELPELVPESASSSWSVSQKP